MQARHRGFAELPQDPSDAPWPPPAPDLFADVAGHPGDRGRRPHGRAPRRRPAAPRIAARPGPGRPGGVRGGRRRRSPVRSGTPRPRAPTAATTGAAPAYVPFEASEGYDFGFIERQFFRFGAVLAVEAPARPVHGRRRARALRRDRRHRRLLRRAAGALGEEDLAAPGRTGRADRVAPGRRVPRRRHPHGQRLDGAHAVRRGRAVGRRVRAHLRRHRRRRAPTTRGTGGR